MSDPEMKTVLENADKNIKRGRESGPSQDEIDASDRLPESEQIVEAMRINMEVQRPLTNAPVYSAATQAMARQFTTMFEDSQSKLLELEADLNNRQMRFNQEKEALQMEYDRDMSDLHAKKVDQTNVNNVLGQSLKALGS